MAKRETVFVCSECGYESPGWLGQCICGAWNTFVEELVQAAPGAGLGAARAPRGIGGAAGGGRSAGGAGGLAVGGQGAGLGTQGAYARARPVPLADVAQGGTERIDTGIGELNRVLGGGLARGTLTLIAGEPGIGKSTLILQAAICMARRGVAALYVSGEESGEQIRMRADRVAPDGIPAPLLMLSETDIENVYAHVEALAPGFLIIDSIQTMYMDGLSSAPGSVSQIRACADVLMRVGKELGVAVFIVAHVTKAGELAGPKVIEHLVDAVLTFSGERERDFRLLTASKNRFGTTNEVGAFDMREDGLAEIADLSGCLLDEAGEWDAGASHGGAGGGDGGDGDGGGGQSHALSSAKRREGIIVTGAYEGTRPLLMELQALTAHAGAGFPRRTSIGVDNTRLGMILAVLEKRAGLYLGDSDVYVNIVGGLKPEGTSSDLAAALAVWSSAKGVGIGRGVVAVGEIGLSGEIRSVRHAERIAAEAAKLGFTRIILPRKSASRVGDAAGISVCAARDIGEAIGFLD